MKILLTGSSGFLGGYIKSKLVNPFCLNRSDNLNNDLSRYVPDFKFSFDSVIHNAGLAHQMSRKFDNKLFYQTNVLGTKNLLRGLNSIGVPKNFIFISSVSVYGIDCGNLLSEETSLNAKDAYGLSKIQSEELIQEWCDINKVNCAIFRLPLVAGFNPPGNLGQMINAINKGYFFNIGNGNAKRSIVLASDVADFVSKTIGSSGIYNLTDGYHPSYSEISMHIARELNVKPPWNVPYTVANFFAKLGDSFGSVSPFNSKTFNKLASTLTFDDSKANKLLGWNPSKVLDGFRVI
jgi:nucleoside-diphosphate-sugar epimerase